jgi:tetratricopeptide (TPR) repeat protein
VLLEQIEERFPGTQSDRMAAVWGVLAHVHSRLGDHDEALESAKHSREILDRRGGEVPAALRAHIARNLLLMAHRLEHAGEADAARVWTLAGADMYESLHAESPEKYLSERVSALNALAYQARSSGVERATEALAHAQEALALLDGAEAEPGALGMRRDLLDTAAQLLCVLDRFDEALPLASEAVELGRSLSANLAGDVIYPAREMTERLLAHIEDRVRFGKAS